MNREEMSGKNSHNNDKEKKPVVIADEYLYESISEAASALGIHATHLSKALNAKHTSYKLREYNYVIAIRFATELDKKTLAHASLDAMDDLLLSLEIPKKAEDPQEAEAPKHVHKLGEPLISKPQTHQLSRCYP